jgi:hypothetical protein
VNDVPSCKSGFGGESKQQSEAMPKLSEEAAKRRKPEELLRAQDLTVDGGLWRDVKQAR